MERVSKKESASITKSAQNPIVKMIEDKKAIVKAIEKGESLSTLKGIKIVSPL
jgi:hypothetical protein